MVFKEILTFFKELSLALLGESKKKMYLRLSLFLLLLIPLFLSIYLRMYPYYLPLMDDFARKSVYYQIKNNILQEIEKVNPFLPEVEKQRIVNQQFEKLISSQKNEIEEQIKLQAKYLKSRLRKDDEGVTYLLAIDPYHYYLLAKNEIEKGFPGDEKFGNYSINLHMYGGAPIKKRIIYKRSFVNLLDLVVSRTYKLLRALGIKIGLMKLDFFMPIIFSALAVFPAFFLGKRLSNNIGGFFSSLVIAIHPFILTRTSGGFSDTDAFNILFPLLIVWLYIESIVSSENKKRILFSFLSGLSLGIYSLAWRWGSIFIVIFASYFVYLFFLFLLYILKLIKLNKIVKKLNLNINKEIKWSTLSFSVFLLSSFVFISLFHDPHTFIAGISVVIKFTKLKAVAQTTIWPNVYTTVAELNEAKISEVIESLGGKMYFTLAILGLILSFTLKREDKTFSIKQGLILLLWFLATVYATTKGVRFILLVVMPFSIALGVFIGLFIHHISYYFHKWFEINKHVIKGSLLVIFLLLFLLAPQGIFAKAQNTAKNELPSMNDAWYNALTKIKNESEKNAIITSWWDFGHWFKAIADRQVTFDGASQNTPMAHWVGRILQTNNETEAMAILRMLDCGSNYAYELLDKELNNSLESVYIIKKIILMNKAKAISYLSNYVNENLSKEIVKYTHCNPPEAYIIASEDMIGKAGVWAHFGTWNFTKASMYKDTYKLPYNKAMRILKSKYKLNETEAEFIYNQIKTQNPNYWISGWPSYFGAEFKCEKKNETLRCLKMVNKQQGLLILINLTNKEAYVNKINNKSHPSSFVYFINGSLHKKTYSNPIFDYAVTLINRSNKYYVVVSDDLLADSMFTRWFFLNGQGVKYSSLFYETRDIFGNRIFIWKVNWTKFINDIEK